MWKKISDWFAINIWRGAKPCPRCGGAARNDSTLGARIYVCHACRFGFTKDNR